MEINFYRLIDLSFILLIFFFTYHAYKKYYYIKFFDFFKLLFLITISAKLSGSTAFFLKKLHIIYADTNSVLLLIAFLLNLLIIAYSFKYFIAFINEFVNSNKIRKTFALLLSFIEVFLLVTFITYMLMQVSFIKEYVYPIVNKSHSYKYVKHFYIQVLNKDFLYVIMNANTKTSKEEIIFTSFKNAL